MSNSTRETIIADAAHERMRLLVHRACDEFLRGDRKNGERSAVAAAEFALFEQEMLAPPAGGEST